MHLYHPVLYLSVQMHLYHPALYLSAQMHLYHPVLYVTHPSDKQAAHDTVLHPMSFVQNSHTCPIHTPNAHTQFPSASQSSPTPFNTLTPQHANLSHLSPHIQPSPPAQGTLTTSSHQPEAPPAIEVPPSTTTPSQINLLPPLYALKSATHWTQMDEHLRIQIVPLVLQVECTTV